MTRFADGPAKDRCLMLRRAPLYLRVVCNAKGEWDALDQLRDTPQATESIVAYRRVKREGMLHIDFTRKSSGWFPCAEYAVVDPQPDDATMRSTEKWRTWCYEQVRKEPVPA